MLLATPDAPVAEVEEELPDRPGSEGGAGHPNSLTKTCSASALGLCYTVLAGAPQILPPLPGSPAINAASGGLATDQRGVARPVAGDFDIGAVEAVCLVPAPFTDSDTDGMDDGIEVIYGFTVDAGNPGEGAEDADGDGQECTPSPVRRR